MNDKLKPCPFCGSEEVSYQKESKSVECETCLVIGPVNEESEAMAVATWNTRANEPCPNCPVKK